MALPALNQDIGQQLHDLSRTGSCIDPKDILEVAESVNASISGDHASPNRRLHADFEALAKYINTAKAEIANIKADKINREFLPETPETPEASIHGATPAPSDEDLMNGPQMPDEANSQDDIDSLLANFD